MDKPQFQTWLAAFSLALGLSPTDSAELAGVWLSFQKQGVTVAEAEAITARLKVEGLTWRKEKRIGQLLAVLGKVRKPPEESRHGHVHCHICGSSGAVRVPAMTFAQHGWPPGAMIFVSCDCQPAPGCTMRLSEYEQRHPDWPIELRRMLELKVMGVFARKSKRITAAAYEDKCKELAEAVARRAMTLPDAEKQLTRWIREQPGVDVSDEEEVEF